MVDTFKTCDTLDYRRKTKNESVTLSGKIELTPTNTGLILGLQLSKLMLQNVHSLDVIRVMLLCIHNKSTHYSNSPILLVVCIIVVSLHATTSRFMWLIQPMELCACCMRENRIGEGTKSHRVYNASYKFRTCHFL